MFYRAAAVLASERLLRKQHRKGEVVHERIMSIKRKKDEEDAAWRTKHSIEEGEEGEEEEEEENRKLLKRNHHYLKREEREEGDGEGDGGLLLPPKSDSHHHDTHRDHYPDSHGVEIGSEEWRESIRSRIHAVDGSMMHNGECFSCC